MEFPQPIIAEAARSTPEVNEEWQDGEEAEHTKEEPVPEKEYEMLVVAVVDAVVHPWAMVVELSGIGCPLHGTYT